MPSKTPVSILQEFCVKHRQVPIYTIITDGTTADDKMFAYEVFAFDLTADGRGRNKSNARHEAAANLILLLRSDERFRDGLSDELEVPRDACPELDAVTMLLDICIDRNLPLAQFQIQQASGAAHAPEFVVECRVASIARVGTFSTKKGAKQLAAKQMLAVLQELQDESVEEQKMQIARNAEFEPAEKIFKKYYEYKKMEIKVAPGVKLADRYLHFVKLNNEIQAKIKEVLYNIDESDEEKVYLICRAMNCRYEDNFVPDHPLGNVHCVEIFCEHNLCFANTVPEVYTEIIDYIKVALSYVLPQTTECTDNQEADKCPMK